MELLGFVRQGQFSVNYRQDVNLLIYTVTRDGELVSSMDAAPPSDSAVDTAMQEVEDVSRYLLPAVTVRHITVWGRLAETGGVKTALETAWSTVAGGNQGPVLILYFLRLYLLL